MDATRPLLAADREREREHEENTHTHGPADSYGAGRHPRHRDLHGFSAPSSSEYHDDDDPVGQQTCCSSCWRVICGPTAEDLTPSCGYRELPTRQPRKDGAVMSPATASSSDSTLGHHHHEQQRQHDGKGNGEGDGDGDGGGCGCGCGVARLSVCWKWLFPERITAYEDFASAEEMGEICYLREKTRERFDASHPDDAEKLQLLWHALFPMLPYDGRVNPRWRDVGFQSDDPATDFRASGRLALQMLLYMADHANDTFKRLVRDNRFPVCLACINVIEMLLVHLELKPIPRARVCPCCGTEYADAMEKQEQQKKQYGHRPRHRPELRGFAALLTNCTWSTVAASSRASAEWPVHTAFAELFVQAMLVLDNVWQQHLRHDPTTNLLRFGEALVATRQRVVAFLARRETLVTLHELRAWGRASASTLTSSRAGNGSYVYSYDGGAMAEDGGGVEGRERLLPVAKR